MKKILIRILALCMGLSALLGCQKQILPLPEYPLDADAIAQALQGLERGDSYTIIEDETRSEELRGYSSLFSLYLPESDRIFAIGILSAHKDGERTLSLVFPGSFAINATSTQELEETLALAARLFGGFENENQIYEQFTLEYDEQNTRRVVFPTPARVPTYPKLEGTSTWKSDVGGVTCRIMLERPKQSEPEEYLRGITIASDWETFFPE